MWAQVRVSSTWTAVVLHNMHMPPYRAAWVAMGLLGLAAAGLIVAAILGVHVQALATGTGVAAFAALVVAVNLKERHDNKLRADDRRRERLESQKRYERQLARRSLDRDCLELLERAEGAIGTILNSNARAQHLLNTHVDEVLLGDNVHSVEIVVKQITDLRAKHRSITAMVATDPNSRQPRYRRQSLNAVDEAEQTGSLTGAVIGPQRRAIETAFRSAESRVENLERYASSVKAVDATYRDWIGSQHAEGLNESVRDLLANTVRDELAAEELRTLTERTAQAKQAFLESVREANLAAETLALPDQRDS